MGWKFDKLDRRYRLTKFSSFLQSRGVSRRVRAAYLTEIRKLLAAVGTSAEDKPGSEPWRDFKAVLKHYRTLEKQHARGLQAAWGHWLAYTELEGVLSPLGLGRDMNHAPLAEALRFLLKDSSSVAVTQLKEADLADVVGLRWYRPLEKGGYWRVAHSSRADSVWIAAAHQPALDIIRAWGYPREGGGDTCRHGAWFLPVRPQHDDHMTAGQLGRILIRKYDAAVAAEITEAVSQSLAALNEKMMLPAAPVSQRAPMVIGKSEELRAMEEVQRACEAESKKADEYLASILAD